MKNSIITLILFLFFIGTRAEEVTPKDTTKVVDIEEIVVIASPKENVKLRQSPLSVTLLSQQDLHANHVVSLRDASFVVPNFFMPDYGSRLTSAIYIRGVGARINTPAVGMYVDNVPYIDKSAFDFNFYDIERIEVLRGPQGTLYGRNTMGGLIKVHTRSPFTYQGTDFKVGYEAESNHYTASFTHYHRLHDKFAFSAGGFYENSDGFFTNEFLHKKVDPLQAGGGRIRAIWLPHENLKLDFTAGYEYSDQGGYAYGLYDRVTGTVEPIAYNEESTYRRGLLNTGLNIEYQADNFIMSAVTGYQNLNDCMFLDQDFSPENIYTIEQKQKLNTVSEEVVFKSKPNRRWQWTTGAFGFYQWLTTKGPVDFKEQGVKEMIEDNVNAVFAGLQKPSLKMPARMGMPEMNMKVKDSQIRVSGDFDTPVMSAAIYHQSVINELFTKGLSLTLGLRLDYEKTSMKYASGSNMNFDFLMGTKLFENLNATPLLVGKEKNDYLQLLPKVALQYRFSSRNSIYATVSKGYRSGGYNIQMFSDLIQGEMQMEAMDAVKNAASRKETRKALMGNAMQGKTVGESANVKESTIYRPETSWNYEIGTHLTLLGGKLQLDAAAFLMQTRDQQIAMFAPMGFGRMTKNAGRSRSIGAELSFTANPVKTLTLSASYGYTNAKFTDYVTNEKSKGELINVDYSDRYVPMVPAHTLNAGAGYTFYFSGDQLIRSLALNVSYSGAGKIYWTEKNDVAQDFYGTLNGRIGLNMGSVQLDLWTRNVLDEDYTTFYFESMGKGFMQPGKPRQCGIDLRYSF